MTEILVSSSQKLDGNEKPNVETILIAFLSLTTMACFSILIGAFRSISCLKKQKFTGNKAENIYHFDSFAFPMMGGFYLAIIYIFAMLFSKAYVMFLINLVSFATGLFSLPHFLSPFLETIVRQDVRRNIILINGTEVFCALCFGTADILAFVITSVLLGVQFWYKLWFLHNIIVIAFAAQSIELLHLNNIIPAITLMVEVNLLNYAWCFTKYLKGRIPIAPSAYLAFPLDLFEKWPDNELFWALSVGEIIIAGTFLAHLLRFDMWLKRGQKLYFYSCFAAYLFGYLIALCISIIYRYPLSQPIMTYCIFTSLSTLYAIAHIKGDRISLIAYLDHPDRPHPLQEQLPPIH